MTIRPRTRSTVARHRPNEPNEIGSRTKLFVGGPWRTVVSCSWVRRDYAPSLWASAFLFFAFLKFSFLNVSKSSWPNQGCVFRKGCSRETWMSSCTCAKCARVASQGSAEKCNVTMKQSTTRLCTARGSTSRQHMLLAPASSDTHS